MGILRRGLNDIYRRSLRGRMRGLQAPAEIKDWPECRLTWCMEWSGADSNRRLPACKAIWCKRCAELHKRWSRTSERRAVIW